MGFNSGFKELMSNYCTRKTLTVTEKPEIIETQESYILMIITWYRVTIQGH